MSITPDALAVPRRSADIISVYFWRRGLFAVQYAGMSKSAIAEVVAARKQGSYEYKGGMPPGAAITEEEAIARFVEGEKGLLKELEDERPGRSPNAWQPP